MSDILDKVRKSNEASPLFIRSVEMILAESNNILKGSLHILHTNHISNLILLIIVVLSGIV
jgi:hypothetical protein